jgi:hypothetical protein
MIPTIVIDNFFPQPDNVRNYALSLKEWHADEELRWPGIRTNSLHTFALDKHAELVWSIYNCLPRHLAMKYGSFKKFDAMFQIVSEDYIDGWIHDDGADLDFAGLIYLNKNPCDDSGTSIYHHITDELEYFGEEERELKKKFLSKPEHRRDYDLLKNNRHSQFKEVTKIENVYNRCIIYDAYAWHRANKYFGKTKEDSRLTLVFFGKFDDGQTNNIQS